MEETESIPFTIKEFVGEDPVEDGEAWVGDQTSGMENGTASVIASIEPVMATVLGILIYKEEMTFVNAFGMILVLASIVILNSNGKRNKEYITIFSEKIPIPFRVLP